MAFSIPLSMSLESANALLAKATHLTEGQRECALREYLEGQSAPPADKKDYVKNDLPWQTLSSGIDAKDIEARIKSGALSISDAMKLMAAPTGLKIRHNPLTGTISVGNGNKWPLASWYTSQWMAVLSLADSIRKYIADNQVAIAKGEAIGKAAKKAA
jgi:hypothetical protein